MKIAAIAGLSLLLLFIGFKAFSLVSEERGLGADLADVEARLTKAQAAEASLKDEANYLADPVNLQKELRARFNYKKAGETMIVIVPPPAH